ncbi:MULTISPECIES: hypothetical protein [Methanohalophilus]|nr:MULTISPECIES: hypothetical protein [Methanohalophilus]
MMVSNKKYFKPADTCPSLIWPATIPVTNPWITEAWNNIRVN